MSNQFRLTVAVSILACTAVLLLTGIATANPEKDFADTRFVAPLPGSSFAVTPEGHAGFDGAMNVSVPTAYTPGAGNLVLGINEGSNRKNKIPHKFDGNDVNGSVLPGIGACVAGHRVYICHMATSKDIETLTGVQIEVLPQTEKRPSVAVGVSDLFANRGPDTNRHSVRSVYAVATKELTSTSVPIYVTLGYGNKRYNNRPFGAVSVQPWERWKFAAEYDSWHVNLGAAYRAWRNEKSGWTAIAYAQYVDWGYPGLGLTFTRGR